MVTNRRYRQGEADVERIAVEFEELGGVAGLAGLTLTHARRALSRGVGNFYANPGYLVEVAGGTPEGVLIGQASRAQVLWAKSLRRRLSTAAQRRAVRNDRTADELAWIGLLVVGGEAVPVARWLPRPARTASRRRGGRG